MKFADLHNTNTTMKTTNSIREALFTLDQSALLCDLPDSELVTGGAITDACRVAGYDESGRVVVDKLHAWSMTVAEFAEHIAPEELSATNYHNEAVTFAVGQSVNHVTDDGTIISATITGFSDGLIDLAFADGDQGSEFPSTCF